MVALKGRHVGQRQKHLVIAGSIVVPALVATGRGNTTSLVNAIGTLRQRGEQVAQNGLVNAREYIQAQQIVGRQSTKHMAQAARILDQLANLAQVIRRRSIARPLADDGNAIRRIGRRNMVGELLQRRGRHQRGRGRQQHMGGKILQRIALKQRTLKARALTHKGSKAVGGLKLLRQLRQRLRALVQQLSQARAHNKRHGGSTGVRAAKHGSQQAQLNIGRTRRRGHALRKLGNADLSGKERLVRLQRLANIPRVRSPKLIGQQRQIVRRELIGIQLNIGQPIALEASTSLLAIHQHITRGVLAGNEALDLKHMPVASLHKAHWTRQALLYRFAKDALGKLGKRGGKLTFRVVPHHHAALTAIGQRLFKARRQLFNYIELCHLTIPLSYRSKQFA